ncbi:carnitine dehydratase [Rhodococcus sp. 06-156-3C]|uniref:aldehyde dehydrogenase n=1 Tax=Nocardiaceae TaxID=85025 RepID=UPI0005230EB5|nr:MULTISPECIES: aldehyde dehydrogenase [Rhodococcus]OZD08719.1 carnitine dehydratase [Rhodococcus sp. 06-156-4C]OZD17297.1 carnitine dehydratase [Rhodococcus sp. 06-156-3C]OZD18634.1 carnitine dehydratase [Rhodococcus sp. 06-156-4a]OZD25041.1 carnitine dehydratase [Rhodococcus sp. 06-156-3b]OZD34199.1 carnitine dehydratase [Rhodococcus sp. 06-156-3]
MEKYLLHIDGERRSSSTGEFFESDNPFEGRPWAQIARGNADDVDRAVTAAHRTMTSGSWAEMTRSQRGLVLTRIADHLAENAESLARTEVRDNGKLYSEMLGQCQYVPHWFRYYGGLADKIEGTVVPIDKAGYFTYTQKNPIGVVGIITPWNSPLLLLVWKLAPALAAGCSVVIKPSEYTSASTLEFVRLLEEAGLPIGVVNVVTGFGAEVGSPLVDHPLVRKISFTGSDATGRRIGEQASRQFKQVSLELGGKSPNIVFDDADIEAAVNGAVSGIFAATGQTCIAGSRLLVQRSIHDDVVDKVVALARSARMGDPMDAQTQVGPVTTRDQYDKVLHYIDVGREDGATLALGGKAATGDACGNGWFVEPTIYTGVDNSSRLAQEEVFGPVLAVIPFDTEDEAISIANDSRYGLGAGVWTQNMGRAFRVSAAVHTGTVWVNTYRAVSYMMPFGGVKDSGLGRENGIGAVEDYLETKSVWINTGAPVGNPFVMR